VTIEGENREQRLRLFLAELAVLHEQYGMRVGGCGECGSPYVIDVDLPDGDEPVGLFLAWDGTEYVFRQGSILEGDR
jgi:hypothetical protein